MVFFLLIRFLFEDPFGKYLNHIAFRIDTGKEALELIADGLTNPKLRKSYL